MAEPARSLHGPDVNTAPIRPARIVVDADGTARSLDYGDVYHPREGASAQARHVFLAGNDLPARWRGRERFVVLETGFGLGNNFLATWAAWREDAARCRALVFVSIDAAPPDAETLSAARRDADLAPLAAELARQWPPLTCNLHRLDFDGGAVQLLLAFGEVAEWLVELTAEVDAFFLDGFAPAVNPAMWDARLYRAMARLAATDATVGTWTAARPVRDGLRSAGFDVRLAPGAGHKRDITLARFSPGFSPRRPPGRRAAVPSAGRMPDDPVVVVGAGLAGCALAHALAEQGRCTLLLERNTDIAGEGSGNAAGLFHGVVHGSDGRHARFHRAAALAAQRTVRWAIDSHGVRGSVAGLLRLDARAGGRASLQSLADRLGLPPDYVRAIDAAQASALAGVPLALPAWHYPGGGWVDPRGLARAFLAGAGPLSVLRTGVGVAALRRDGARWMVLDHHGAVLARASAVVLADAGAALNLLGQPGWPVRRTRGQLSSLPLEALPSHAIPRLPVAGSGYVLPAIEGAVWFGATAQAGDEDPAVRATDHRENLDRLAGLVGPLPGIGLERMRGRTGFRWVSDDRLPVIGAVPQGAELLGGSRLDQPRLVPREPGLFVSTALGSRGIASSVLGARIVASALSGAPSPAEADLLDALDPARFLVREVRRRRQADALEAAAQPPVGPMAGSVGV
jgi:tRNA 5-methylaminomethyl-2-thiouridine biosynthesis bifunctional protein